MLFNVYEIFRNTFHNYANFNIFNCLQSKKDKRPWKLMPCQICIPKDTYVCVIFRSLKRFHRLKNNKITILCWWVTSCVSHQKRKFLITFLNSCCLWYENWLLDTGLITCCLFCSSTPLCLHLRLFTWFVNSPHLWQGFRFHLKLPLARVRVKTKN